MSPSFRLFLVLAAASLVAVAEDSTTPTIVDTVLHYHPSTPASGAADGAYVAASVALFAVLCRGKDWWGLCLPIGALCEAIGYVFRILLAKNPNSTGFFTGMQLLVVCSPAAFLAFNYIVYGRFVRLCVGREYSIMRPERVATIFVVSDVTTFLIQAAGGSMQIQKSLMNIGQKVFLVGIILQGVSYFLFCFLLVHTHWSIRKGNQKIGTEPWWKLLWALYFSSLFIVIRCVYRIAEVIEDQGTTPGKLITHEIYFYLLDTLPLLIAIVVYVPFWPGKYFKGEALDREMAALHREETHN